MANKALAAYDQVRMRLSEYRRQVSDHLTEGATAGVLPAARIRETKALLQKMQSSWESFIREAKPQFGVAEIEQALEHLGFDKNGVERRTFTGA